MSDIFLLIAGVLLLEGLFYAALPGLAKRLMASMLDTPEQQVRAMGLVAAVLGLFVVWLVKGA